MKRVLLSCVLWFSAPALTHAQVVGVVCTSPDGVVSQGTGVVDTFFEVVIDGQTRRFGKVITAEHVIAAAGKIEIVMPSGARTTARISGVSHNLDLALLHVDEFPEQIEEIKKAVRAVRGTKVTARNHAGQSVGGIISEVYPNEYTTVEGVTVRGRVISMTTPVVPGYSGGPIFNEAGEMVGISLAKGPTNYGVCVSEVRGFVNSLRNANLQRILRESRN